MGMIDWVEYEFLEEVVESKEDNQSQESPKEDELGGELS